MRNPLAALGPLVFDSAADALFLLDPERDRILDANAAARAVTGCDGEQLLHRRPDTLFRLESGEPLPAGFFRHTPSPEVAYAGRWQLRHEPDGAWVPVQ